jgi:hypothetical protein
MNNINCIFAFIVAMISFLGSITIFILSFYYPKSIFYHNKNKNRRSYSISKYANNQFHSANNSLNMSLKENINFNNNIKDFHISFFLNKYENKFENYKEVKKLRNLDSDGPNYFNIAIYINFFTFYLCFCLFISFFIEENECGCSCCDEPCNFKCEDLCKDESDKSNDPCGNCLMGVIYFLAIIVLIILLGFIYGTYFLTKMCGKHVSRYITLGIISFNNIIICIFCFLIIKEKEPIIYTIIGISGFIVLSNILWMILNRLCKKKESKIYMSMNENDKLDNQNDCTSAPPPAPLFGNDNITNERITVK